MKQTLRVVSIIVLVLFINGCGWVDEQEKAAREWIQVEQLQPVANEVVSEIQYIKDRRTGLCFAYHWRGSMYGGPALATVPCEAIPAELLTVAEIPAATKN